MSNKYSIELAYDDAESPIEYLSMHGRVEWADKRTALKHARGLARLKTRYGLMRSLHTISVYENDLRLVERIEVQT